MNVINYENYDYILYSWIITDGGRSTSKRPQQYNDCSVICLSIILDISYDKAYDALKEKGRISHDGFYFPIGKPYRKNGILLDHYFKWNKQRNKVNLFDISKKLNNGRYILSTVGHVNVIIDGVIYDTLPPNLSSIIDGYWSIEKVN